MLYVSSTFAKDKTPFKEVLEICRLNGIYNIEIGSNHSYEKSYDYIKHNSEINFLVHNYFPIPKDDFVINIASSNNEIRLKSIDSIFKSINFCKEIGSKLYTFHPGFHTDPKGASLFKSNYDFNWDDKNLHNNDIEKNFEQMLDSFEKIINFAYKKKIKIAFETEGSVSKKNHLLMQQPHEYKKFFSRFSYDEIGINLNIGHLVLASNAFKFDMNDFVDLISKYIVAFELSHNNGVEDQHLPIISNAWYWGLILDERFKDKIKILEFRNQSINKVKNTIQLFKRKSNA